MTDMDKRGPLSARSQAKAKLRLAMHPETDAETRNELCDEVVDNTIEAAVKQFARAVQERIGPR